jgi:glycosyltransferase involved in cell wall biosynthesis
MTFVGNGYLLSSLKKHVHDKGLSDHITFLGGVDNSLLPEILHQNDIYLSASLRDGTSLSLLEAMSTGIFPIVSNIRANSDWLENGVNGLLYKADNPEDLVKCILKVRDNPELVVTAVQRNRNKVVEEGDRKTNMKRLERIYDELMKNKGS